LGKALERLEIATHGRHTACAEAVQGLDSVQPLDKTAQNRTRRFDSRRKSDRWRCRRADGGCL